MSAKSNARVMRRGTKPSTSANAKCNIKNASMLRTQLNIDGNILEQEEFFFFFFFYFNAAVCELTIIP